jgi:hypothetical protein
MQLAAPGARHVMFQHLADQGVPEAVPRSAGRIKGKQSCRRSLIQRSGRILVADPAHLA